MNDNPLLLEISGLECWRGDLCLFESFGLSIRAGQALQVTGANGSGKTTLLRAICGLTRAENGEIRWRGQPVDQSAALFRSEILYLGHENGLKLELSARENLRALKNIAGRPRNVSPEEGLARLGLEDFAHRPVRTLSSGQRRRVALARMTLVEASLWLLDEPFTALDDEGTARVNRLVDEHLDAGGALLFTSHAPIALTGGAPGKIALGA